ncbi:bifunctional 2-polyprenyl-6-hydroxyphenol methylase/3-demethylubiquinol 3-O-methyltransferase UbiG [Alphaproteobacteria bacterium]|nr:bifunctional 2-polyprenyl-6-hydroxyphenol methylase/3-demethylubiquinol 3-O-methyltransferase UbiG [Alphaproteobacteria bacterium]
MTNTVDVKEIEQFSLLSNKWWDKSGPFSALHKLSNARIEFIKNNASRIISHKNSEAKFLEGIECIDIGCGGGILSERLSRLGAKVTGIDASESSINVAKEHSFKSRLEIDYKCLTTSELLRSKKDKFLNKFDIVIASEVIEHVNERKIFLSDISKLSRSGGLIVFTTINKSFLGILLGKFFAENILKVVPKNTHDPNKFISPQKLSSEAKEHNIILDNFVGFVPTLKINNILKKEFGDFRLSSYIDVNYGAAGIRL